MGECSAGHAPEDEIRIASARTKRIGNPDSTGLKHPSEKLLDLRRLEFTFELRPKVIKGE